MQMGDDNNENCFFYNIYSKWLTIYTILAFAIYLIIPFPLLLLVSLGITLLMNAILKGIKIKIIINKFKLNRTFFKQQDKKFYFWLKNI